MSERELPFAVQQSLELDFYESAKIGPYVLEALALADGPLTVRQLSDELGARASTVGKAVRRLMEATDMYAAQLNYSISEGEGKRGKWYYLLSTADDDTLKRYRGIKDLPRRPVVRRRTGKDQRLASRLCGLPLLSEVPTDWESIVHRAAVLRHEDKEAQFFSLLLSHAKAGNAVLTLHAKNLTDLPYEDDEVQPLRTRTLPHALVYGFFVDVIDSLYQTVWFVDPDARESALYAQCTTDEFAELPYFDHVMPYSPKAFHTLFYRFVRPRMLADGRVLYASIVAYVHGFFNRGLSAPTSSQVNERFGFKHHRKLDSILKLSFKTRFEYGFYLKRRGGGRSTHGIDIVRLDMKKYRADYAADEEFAATPQTQCDDLR